MSHFISPISLDASQCVKTEKKKEKQLTRAVHSRHVRLNRLNRSWASPGAGRGDAEKAGEDGTALGDKCPGLARLVQQPGTRRHRVLGERPKTANHALLRATQ